MIKTQFFDDFVRYYEKAKILQERNLLIHDNLSGDPIMDNITIYDTVNRRYAGFSKALEDIHGVRQRKDLVRYGDFSKKLDSNQFHFIHLFHRFTGSGASFEPTFLGDGTRNPSEHGYCNNHVEQLAIVKDLFLMREYIRCNTKPMVTSRGNQPPSLKNPNTDKYRLAQQYYFYEIAASFVNDYLTFLMNNEYKNNIPTGIKEAVDFSLSWHKERGFKQWHFVLTAFVMDTAEYYPELVDSNSHCYYGANCIRSFKLMFDKEKKDKEKGNDYFEKCMTEVCNVVKGKPYDVEDVCCDYIRYIVEYVPKGYEHLTKEKTLNKSILKINDFKYNDYAEQRINQILKS